MCAYLQSFIKDNERKIESAKKRLTATQETPEMEEKVCVNSGGKSDATIHLVHRHLRM